MQQIEGQWLVIKTNKLIVNSMKGKSKFPSEKIKVSHEEKDLDHRCHLDIMSLSLSGCRSK